MPGVAVMGVPAPSHAAPETFERGISDLLRLIKIENEFQTGDA